VPRWYVQALFLLCLPAVAPALVHEHLPFGVRVNGLENRFPVFGVFAMPEQILHVELLDIDGDRVHASFDTVSLSVGQGGLRLKMPSQPGTHLLEITDADGRATMRLNVFVMWQHEGDRRTVLNGYRIGQYPSEPFRGLTVYEPPSGFVEVTPDNARLEVSPNFRLGQFVSKQSSGYPKYVVLRPELLQKLETILGALNAHDERITSLTVMSGYRTPHYNQAIGNGRYSRHVWGGAADIFVDLNGNGRMDDLDGDGQVTRADSEWLAAFVDAMERRGDFGEQLIGGIGTYGANAAHGPFVHVDARGYQARW
jgi:hypothetical protein